MYITKWQLLSEWRGVRESFKLDGHKLTEREQSGLLIEELGSVTAALRYVQTSQDVPFFTELGRPTIDRGVREILSFAWMADQGDRLHSVRSLIDMFEERSQQLDMKACPDSKLLAGMLLKEHGEKIRSFIHELGWGLYSPMHFTTGFATNPAARDVLFVLEMVLWTEKKMAER